MKNKPLDTNYINKKTKEFESLDEERKNEFLAKITHPDNVRMYAQEVRHLVKLLYNYPNNE